MNHPRARIVRAMVEYFGTDDRRIEHALQVLRHAEQMMQERPACDPEVVIAAALLHDVGIKVSEEKLGYSARRIRTAFAASAALSSATCATNVLPMAAADRPRRFNPFSASAWQIRAPCPVLSAPSTRTV